MGLEVGGDVWREARLSLSCIIESSSLKPVRTVLTWPSRLFLPDCKLPVLPATFPTRWLRASLSESSTVGRVGFMIYAPDCGQCTPFTRPLCIACDLTGNQRDSKNRCVPESQSCSRSRWQGAPPHLKPKPERFTLLPRPAPGGIKNHVAVHSHMSTTSCPRSFI